MSLEDSPTKDELQIRNKDLLAKYKVKMDEVRKEISGRHLEVLVSISQSAPVSKYEIRMKTRLAYSVVHKAVRDLLDKRFISVANTRIAKNQNTIQEYDLTGTGLLHLLRTHFSTYGDMAAAKEEPITDLADIVKRYNDRLPLILGKWDYFTERGIEDLAEFSLVFAITTFLESHSYYFFQFIAHNEDWKIAEVALTTLFVVQEDPRPFASAMRTLTDNQYNRWLKAMAGDKDLAALAAKKIKEILEYFEEEARFWRIQRQLFKKSGPKK